MVWQAELILRVITLWFLVLSKFFRDSMGPFKWHSSLQSTFQETWLWCCMCVQARSQPSLRGGGSAEGVWGTLVTATRRSQRLAPPDPPRYTLNESIIDDHLNVGCILGLGVAPLLTPRIISPAMSQHFRKPQSQENVSKYTKIEPLMRARLIKFGSRSKTGLAIYRIHISLFVSSICGLFINELLYMVHVGKHYIHRLYKQSLYMSN